ncbi:MAG: hypothetical protein ACF8OB_13775 [Phycisphaeraceae bacterium JB051]
MNRYLQHLAVLLTLSLPTLAMAQTNGDWFTFSPPWDDATPNTIIDMSHLNAKPAGKNGWIKVDGHTFIESDTGKRVRFLGTNTTAWHCFPTQDQAEKIAARMAKFGINIVRLHHMDNRWDIKSGSSIWKLDDNGALHIDENQLDKMDYFVAQLKKHGIYVNINLKVSKLVSAADGFPEGIKDLKTHYHKRVDRFDPQMIEHQKNFARELLTHVNPYTKLAYTDDPAVAVVEINNENGLLGEAWGNIAMDMENFPEPFNTQLLMQWNDWLNKQYSSDQQLAKAWSNENDAQTEPVFRENELWKFSTQGKSKGKLQAENNPNGELHIAMWQTDGKNYHAELHRRDLRIRENEGYILRFKARAKSDRVINLAVMRDREDYRNCGLTKTVKLTENWQAYEFPFTGYKIDPGHTRLTFKVGQNDIDIWLDEITIEPNTAGMGLLEGESLAKKNIHIPTASSKQQRKDWIAFLVDVETRFAREMRDFLKNDLGVKSMVIDSQIDWGGLSGYAREAIMDYADVHSYWQHPSFPGGGWSHTNWTIDNSSMVNAWGQGETGTLDKYATQRLVDKPFSVSEYDHSAPSEYNAETMPLFAAIAASQDWDAIYSFEYGPVTFEKDQNRIGQFFDHGSHPAKISFYPAAAMLFRQANLKPLQATGTLTLPDKAYLQFDRAKEAWEKAKVDISAYNVLNKRMGMKMGDDSTAKLNYALTLPATEQAGQPTVQSHAAGSVFTTSSPKASVIVGQIGGHQNSAGVMAIQCPDFEKNFGAMTLTAMDDQPIVESSSVLLTAIAQGRNKNMKWNKAHNSISNQWGSGPTEVLAIPGKVTIRCDKLTKVYALDQAGQRDHQVTAQRIDGQLVFNISAEHKTVWYELTDQ